MRPRHSEALGGRHKIAKTTPCKVEWRAKKGPADATVATWFETHGAAVLLTMRV